MYPYVYPFLSIYVCLHLFGNEEEAKMSECVPVSKSKKFHM